MPATKQLEQSRALTAFFHGLNNQCDRSQAMAFGVKLMDLLPLQREEIEKARRYFVSAQKVNHTEMTDIMMKNFSTEMAELAKEMEANRRPREANAMRCIFEICEAYTYPDNPSLAMFCVSKSAVKAMYAGADVAQIKTAAALLFG